MIFSAVLCVIGYMFGSIPFGLVLSYLFGYGDIRTIGSGNIGATNVLRTGNKILAFLTLVLDAGKGAIPIGLFFIFNQFIYQPVELLTIALGAILGHNFPIWLKFKGGKGIATTFGTLLAATPVIGLIACLVWLVSAKVTRISSLSALISLATISAIGFFLLPLKAAAIIVVIALIGYIRHKDNIVRLINGQEPKIGHSKHNS